MQLSDSHPRSVSSPIATKPIELKTKKLRRISVVAGENSTQPLLAAYLPLGLGLDVHIKDVVVLPDAAMGPLMVEVLAPFRNS